MLYSPFSNSNILKCGSISYIDFAEYQAYLQKFDGRYFCKNALRQMNRNYTHVLFEFKDDNCFGLLNELKDGANAKLKQNYSN